MTVTPIIDRRLHVQPAEVHNVLSRHMLADGYDIVMDLEKSKGSWVFDARRGRAVLDFFTNFASCPIGYNHPRLDNPEFRDKIATASINKPANSDIYTTYMAEFVETFARIAVPPTLNKHMFFIEGGALGIENAVKTAFDWKVRKNFKKGYQEEKGTQIMHLREAFHGRTGYTLSLTNTDPKKTQYFPKFDWPRIENPKLTFPLTEQSQADAARREEAALAQAKQFLAERKDDVAAFIMEPIQGEGGDNHFRPEFFRAIRQLCDENEMLLIFDEVQSGVGITGRMWSFQHYGVEPDLFCFGKKTQVCGFASNDRIFDIDDNVFKVSSRINSTWGGNLTDMVRSQRYFEVIDEERLVENAATVGAYFVGELQRFADEFPSLVSNVRGRGLMAAFDLPSGELRDNALRAFMGNDVMVLSSGHQSARFRPPLNLTMDEAAEGIRRMEKALRQMA
ncbi:MAG TPA: L-lysine 6-transaminase [Thermoanaerobaculia bacterium]|jgi:L-lysine 6-transaminase|nr:L-lysine 6-transaminase [Thermoanaerobaculia bacterium]